MRGDGERLTGSTAGASRFGNWLSRIEVAQEFEAEARALLEPLESPMPPSDIEPETGREPVMLLSSRFRP